MNMRPMCLSGVIGGGTIGSGIFGLRRKDWTLVLPLLNVHHVHELNWLFCLERLKRLASGGTFIYIMVCPEA